MDVEQRARHPNPNVRVIEAARDYFPKDHYMYCALDHASAELAVLHERCQRAALTPPEGFVLVPKEPTSAMQDAVESMKLPHALLRTGVRLADFRERYAAMLAASPEVKL